MCVSLATPAPGGSMQARPLITEDSALLAAEQTLAAAMETGQGLDEMIPEAVLLTESLVSSVVPGDSPCLTVEKQRFSASGEPPGDSSQKSWQVQSVFQACFLSSVLLCYYFLILKTFWNEILNPIVLYNCQNLTHMISYNPIINFFSSPTPILPCPPSLSPLVTTSLFSRSWVCFFFVLFTSLLYFLDSTDKRYHTVFVFLWLISLSIMPSKSTHVAANGNISSNLWLGSILLHTYAPQFLYLFICWWTLRLLPCVNC